MFFVIVRCVNNVRTEVSMQLYRISLCSGLSGAVQGEELMHKRLTPRAQSSFQLPSTSKVPTGMVGAPPLHQLTVHFHVVHVVACSIEAYKFVG